MITFAKSLPLIISLLIFCCTGYCGEVEDGALKQLEYFRTKLIAPLDKSQKLIAEKIVIEVPTIIGIGNVGAFVDFAGTPRITINVGALYQLKQLSEAFLIAKYIVKSDQFFFGYARYVAHWNYMGENPLTPLQFAKYYGITDVEAKRANLSEEQLAFGWWMEATNVSFILAHEIAHHVNGDTNKKIAASLTESRDQETRADAWATARLLDAGLNPAAAIASLLVLNELEQKSAVNEDFSKHKAALSRSVELSGHTLNYFKSNSKKISIALKEMQAPYSYETVLQALESIDTLIKQRAKIQADADYDTKNLMNSAKDGDIFSQIRLGELYGSGENESLPYNMKLSLMWFGIAALNTTKYDYFDSARANFKAGAILGFSDEVPHDYVQACFFLRSSSEKDYAPGVAAFNALKITGKCS